MCMFLMPDPCLAEDSCPIVRERTVQGGHLLKIYRTQSTVSVVVDVIGIIPSHLDHPEKHGPLEGPHNHQHECVSKVDPCSHVQGCNTEKIGVFLTSVLTGLTSAQGRRMPSCLCCYRLYHHLTPKHVAGGAESFNAAVVLTRSLACIVAPE